MKAAETAGVPGTPWRNPESCGEVSRLAQEAVEVHFEGENLAIPSPTPIEKLAVDPNYEGGFWLLLDVDLSKVNTKSVRLNISLPANLVGQIDHYAAEHHMTRSGFLAKAALQAIGNGT